jgi:hypothetical protein
MTNADRFNHVSVQDKRRISSRPTHANNCQGHGQDPENYKGHHEPNARALGASFRPMTSVTVPNTHVRLPGSSVKGLFG